MDRPPDPAASRRLAAAVEAADRYRGSLGEDFEPCAVDYAAGRALDMAGRPDRAVEVWLGALEHASARGWPALMNALTDAARRLGAELEVAARLEARAEALPELHLWRGHLLRLAGEAEAALPCLDRAWERTQGELRFTALTETLQVLVDLGRLDQAISRCREALPALPDHALALRVSLAGLLTRAGQAEDALAELDGLLAEAPRLGVAHLNRGAALLRLGRRAEAERALQAAVSLDASTSSAAARLWATP